MVLKLASVDVRAEQRYRRIMCMQSPFDLRQSNFSSSERSRNHGDPRVGPNESVPPFRAGKHSKFTEMDEFPLGISGARTEHIYPNRYTRGSINILLSD